MQTSTYYVYLPGKGKMALTPPLELAAGEQAIVETPDGQWCLPVQRWPADLIQRLPHSAQWIRQATAKDLKLLATLKERAQKAHTACLSLIVKYALEMRLSQTLVSFDQKKLIFYFTAPQRVDFRALLQDLIKDWRQFKISLRQVSAREETGLFGGLGPCGQELCCSTFLKQFENITLQLAEDQGLPPNPARLSGNCGRLKCCLQYEQDYYLYLREQLPAIGSQVIFQGQKAKIVRHLILQEAVEILAGKTLQIVPRAELSEVENL